MMLWQELRALVEEGESEILEFKESTAEIKKGFQTICAFLNTKGGTVLFGVRDKDCAILGQDISDNTKDKINQEINKLEPSADISIKYYQLGPPNRQAIALSTNVGDHIPYIYDGKAYHRVQKSTLVMPQEKYKQLLLKQVHSLRPWEKLPAIGMSIKDLDEEEIFHTIKDGIAMGRINPQLATQDVEEALVGLQLLENKQITNAAAILFGTRLSIHYTQCQVLLARFSGNEKNEFLDNRRIQGHAFLLLKESVSFVHRHTSVASSFSEESIVRKDVPAYPPLAVREAIINSLVHRDYTQTGGISIAIFDDYLEIWSAGSLSKDITLDELWGRHPSKPRNKLIADVFYTRGFLEEWGRGTLKIIEECKRNGNKPPEFIEQTGSFCVRIWANKPTALKPQAVIQQAPISSLKELTGRQQAILGIIHEGRQLKTVEIAKRLKLDIADRTLRTELNKLKKLGFIVSRGRGGNAVWLLAEFSLKLM